MRARARPIVIPRRLADEGPWSRNALFDSEVPQSLSLHRDDTPKELSRCRGWRISRDAFALALNEGERAVHAGYREPLAAGDAAGPVHFDGVDAVLLPESEVHARVVAGKVAVRPQAQADARDDALGADQGHAGADRLTLASHRQHLEPVVVLRGGGPGGIVAEHAHGVVEVNRHHVDRAAVEQIRERHRPADLDAAGERSGAGADVGETTGAVAAEQEARLGEAVPERAERRLRARGTFAHPAVDDREVQLAVVVEIEES